MSSPQKPTRIKLEHTVRDVVMVPESADDNPLALVVITIREDLPLDVVKALIEDITDQLHDFAALRRTEAKERAAFEDHARACLAPRGDA